MIDSHINGTGPIFLTDQYMKYEDKSSFTLPSRKYFHPENFNDVCYGRHICTGRWRNNML